MTSNELDLIGCAVRRLGCYEVSTCREAQAIARKLKQSGIAVRVSSRGRNMPKTLIVLGVEQQ